MTRVVSGTEERRQPAEALASGESAEASWMSVVERAADVATAVKEAQKRGTLSSVGAVVLLLYYLEGRPLREVATLIHVSPSTVRRELREALKALRETGLLDGYE